jgi:uncharacterized protein YbjT (DUF2867 family)
VVILIAGASGFIGSRLAAACVHAGHTVICASRDARAPGLPGTRLLRFDYTAMPPAETLRDMLAGVDVVVNAVGILREHGAQTFEALHVTGPSALFAAAAQAGVRRIVQVSALGAEDGAVARYHTSKHRADLALAALPVDWVIVQPSLVYGAGGTSARLFELLASLPVIPVPGNGEQRVQPVHVQDVITALLALIQSPAQVRGVLPFVGPVPMSLRTFLRDLRDALGFPPAPVVRVPRALVRLGAALGDRWRSALLDRETLGMLERGNVADPKPLEGLLGRPALPVARFVAPERRVERGAAASWRWLAPLLRLAVAAMWLIAAVVSVGPYPVADSVDLLRSIGLPAAWARPALYGAAALDLVLGVLTLWPRRGRWLWNAQIALVLAYTAIITWRLPELWLEPFGPVAKNVPILVLLLTLREMDGRR